MKKTIVAAAVAAVFAAPVAMADVSISGAVQFETGEFDDSTVAGGTDNRIKTDIKFSGSEDLGNGLKAGFKIVRTKDENAAASGETDAYITVSGDFGQVKVGGFEQYLESSIGAMAANDASHDVSNEISDGESDYDTAREAIEVSVSPMAGLTVGYQMADNADTVYAAYSNAGLTVRIGSENNDDGDDVIGLAASYKMDGLTVTAVSLDNNSGDAPAWYGASYTMGANTIAASVVDGGDTDGDTTLSLSHALSKSTNVYLVMGTDDGTPANDETVVGIKHTF
jgi:hypothetical protein